MKRWGIICIFVVLVTGFFYKTVFFGKLPVPTDALVGLYHPWRDLYAETNPRGIPFKNFLITDPVRQQIPWRKSVIETWKSGRWPIWDPYTFTGVPLDGNVQAGAFYPFNILFFLFEFPDAWTILIVIQPLLAGIFMYWYLRRLGLTTVASCSGAFVWAFSGFSISWLTWGTVLQTALWMPLMLLAVDMVLKPGTSGSVLGWYGLFVLAAVMAIFAGHVQVALYVLLLGGVYFLYRAKQTGNTTMFRRGIITLGVIALITAAQWVPFVVNITQSGRINAMESWRNAGWFLPWQHLIQFLVPDYFGNPATLNYWGIWNYGEFIGYVGIIPIVLAISMLGFAGVPAFFTVTLLASLFFMLPHPVSILPYALRIPIISVLQPTRLMVIVDFSLSVLAAFGMDRVVHGNTKNVQKCLYFVGIAIAALWVFTLGAPFIFTDTAFIRNMDVAKRNLVIPSLFFAIWIVWMYLYKFQKQKLFRRVAVIVLIAGVTVDLFRFGWKFTPFTPREYFYPQTMILAYLQKQPKPFRIMSLDDRILPPNVSGYYGIETLEGYDPIAPQVYENFLSASERGNAELTLPTGFNRIYTAHNIDSPLLPYFNVRYVLSLTDIDKPQMKFIMKEGETRLYEYIPALPRMFVAPRVLQAGSPEDMLRLLIGAPAGAVGVVGKKVDVLSLPLSAEEGAKIISYTSQAMDAEVLVRSSRLLVILNRFDSRWHATIDGTKADIFPVNYLFSGIVVPVGRHTVKVAVR